MLAVNASKTWIIEKLDRDLEIHKDSSLHINHAVKELVFPQKLVVQVGW